MGATVTVPERTREYRNHHLDSTRWDRVRFRPGDVVISTSLKAGTTWMQRILSLLALGAGPLPGSLWRISPWIDQRFVEPIDAVIERIDAQRHRRFFKSHLPLDALPYDPDVRYVFVTRDPRDVFMSLWNHYSAYTDVIYAALDGGDRVGDPIPRCPADPRQLWSRWVTTGWFEWEPDGWPFWSHHHHAASFWPFRHLPNVAAFHFNDLLADLDGEMRRVAAFCGFEIDEEQWPELVAAARFSAMKAGAAELLPEAEIAFDGGSQRFINKGTNGRWRELLTADDLALLDDHLDRILEPDLRRWLEAGAAASEPAR